jgi:hypothetical protein
MSLVKSSDSGQWTPVAIDRKLGRTVVHETGEDDSLELGVASLDGGEDELYSFCIGASLYFSSPAVRSGYSDEEVECAADDGMSFAGGPR